MTEMFLNGNYPGTEVCISMETNKSLCRWLLRSKLKQKNIYIRSSKVSCLILVEISAVVSDRQGRQNFLMLYTHPLDYKLHHGDGFYFAWKAITVYSGTDQDIMVDFSPPLTKQYLMALIKANLWNAWHNVMTAVSILELKLQLGG